MKSFGFAFRGVFRTIRTERNMRIHLAFAFYVLCACAVCRAEGWQWCACLICIGLVTALECLNTALEAVCDGVTAAERAWIRRAKDAAAGAVLLAAVCAAAVGCVIFFTPAHLRAVLDFAKTYPLGAAAIVLTVPLWILFIFKRRSQHA